MRKILFTTLSVFLFAIAGKSQCTFSGTQYGSGSAPVNLNDVTTASTCNYYGEYSPITSFLSSTVYSLNINTGGYITVFDASFTAVAFGPTPLLFTPPADGDYNIQWNDVGCGTDFNCHTTTITNVGFAAACTNPALGGTTVSNVTTACSGQPFNLSLTGASTGSGLTYQWQSSADGITYNDIISGTSSSLSISQTSMTYYQCIVTCSAGTQATSTEIMVEMGTCVTMQNGTATTCGGNFYDSGAGTGNYLDNEVYTMTIFPSTPGSLLQVNFNTFQLETCCDDLTVYNGNSTAAPLMGSFATNPGSITSSAADGSLTFVFYSDGSVVYSGWDASLSCVLPPANDLACNSIPIVVDGVANTFNNGGAGVEAGESAITPPTTGYNETDGWGNSTLSFTTWFTFEAPTSGNITLSCTDIDFDGQVAIYSTTDCADFSTYTLVAANDDAVDFSSAAPMFTVCGLTPGETYYLMYDSGSSYASGEFSIAISPLTVNAGDFVDVLNACSGETLDLFNGISGNDAGGTWYEMIPTVGLSGSMFNTTGLAYQLFDFEYIVVDGCATDTSDAQIHIYGPSSAGEDGTLSVCKNQTYNLLDGLSGLVDLGGTWYDPSNQPLVGNTTTASNIPGQFNYDYITGNGVCPDDTANVLVTVNDCTAGLNEFLLNDISIYPNPTDGIVYISNEGSTEVFSFDLLDLNGRLLDTQIDVINGNTETQLNLTGKVNGIYMIRVYNESIERVYRVVLQ